MTISKFTKGLFFAWIPLLVFTVPMFLEIFRSISSDRATGLGAVAGGISEGLAVLGLATIVTCEIYAIVVLARTLKETTPAKSLTAIVSIVSGATLLILMGALIVWVRHMSSM